jgi:serine protease AprX
MSDKYDANHDDGSLFNLERGIGARAMWKQQWTGRGVDVAVVDSGVAPVAGLSGPGKVMNGPDLTEESQSSSTGYLDTFGHGTQMAAIIAGADAGVNPPADEGNHTKFMGVAPAAGIVSVKVANARGLTDVSQVLAGIDWVVQHAHDPGMNIRVLNLSFGTASTQDYLIDPLSFAAEQAWRRGIVVVASAGNTGTSKGRLSDPAINPFIIAVGTNDTRGTEDAKDDRVASFSARGDGTRNPDLLAPGMHVQSLRVGGTYIDDTFSSTGSINSRFFRGSGTSQSAAVVSGAAALLIEQHPDYSPDQIKSLLVSTATRLKGAPATAQGNGVINLRAASKLQAVDLAQSFDRATGGGSLDGSRGGMNQVLRGTPLSGDQDIFGRSVDTAALAATEASGASWSGGDWNGSSWAGSSWSDHSWSSCAWSGSDWSGSSWSSDRWSSGSWTGSSWSDSSWTGSSWSGSEWHGSSWSDSSLSDGVWATDSWS